MKAATLLMAHRAGRRRCICLGHRANLVAFFHCFPADPRPANAIPFLLNSVGWVVLRIVPKHHTKLATIVNNINLKKILRTIPFLLNSLGWVVLRNSTEASH